MVKVKKNSQNKLKNFFNNFLNVKSITLKKENKEKLKENKIFLENIKKAESLIYNIKILEEKINFLNSKIINNTLKIKEIQSIENLDANTRNELSELLTKYSVLNNEKILLQKEILIYKNTIDLVENFKEDVFFNLEQIIESENKQKILKHDINFFESEKGNLDYEKDLITKKINLLKKFLLSIISISSIIICILTYYYVSTDNNIIKHLFSIGFSTAIPCIFLIFKIRKHTKKFLKIKNNQDIILEKIEKKSFSLSYYNSFLKHEFRKYKVNNVKSLKEALNNLNNLNNLNKKLEANQYVLYQLENKINLFFKYNNISSTNKLDLDFINNLNSKNNISSLIFENKNLNAEINNLDYQLNLNWDNIIELNKLDNSSENYINQIILNYFNNNYLELDKEELIV